jgi:hypothetical protein
MKLLAASRMMQLKNKKVKSRGSNDYDNSPDKEIMGITVFDNNNSNK